MNQPSAATMTPIDVPDRPDVPGLVLRHYRGLADIPAMAAANQAARSSAGALEVVTPESMANQYSHFVHCDPERDILVAEIDGRTVGYARAEWRDQIDGSREFESYCLLVPEASGRGIGTAMLGWTQSRLRDMAARVPADRPSRLGAWTWDSDAAATSRLTADGWTLDRQAHDLLRPDFEAIPDLDLPAGLEVRPVTRADSRVVWDALIEAFEDHPGEPVPADEDYAEWHASPREDPTLWVIASAGDELAGGVLGLVEPPLPGTSDPARRGLLDAVFTRPAWRRRGLARALIAVSLRQLRDRGLRDAYLGVDAANPNQAMSLYESVGFRTACTEDYWTKPLPDGVLGSAIRAGDGR
jgi:GNAT superfamily N-acetyltransferase